MTELELKYREESADLKELIKKQNTCWDVALVCIALLFGVALYLGFGVIREGALASELTFFVLVGSVPVMWVIVNRTKRYRKLKAEIKQKKREFNRLAAEHQEFLKNKQERIDQQRYHTVVGLKKTIEDLQQRRLVLGLGVLGIGVVLTVWAKVFNPFTPGSHPLNTLAELAVLVVGLYVIGKFWFMLLKTLKELGEQRERLPKLQQAAEQKRAEVHAENEQVKECNRLLSAYQNRLNRATIKTTEAMKSLTSYEFKELLKDENVSLYLKAESLISTGISPEKFERTILQMLGEESKVKPLKEEIASEYDEWLEETEAEIAGLGNSVESLQKIYVKQEKRFSKMVDNGDISKEQAEDILRAIKQKVDNEIQSIINA